MRRLPRSSWLHVAPQTSVAAVGGPSRSTAVATASNATRHPTRADEQLDRRRLLASIALLASYDWLVAVYSAHAREGENRASHWQSRRTRIATSSSGRSSAWSVAPPMHLHQTCSRSSWLSVVRSTDFSGVKRPFSSSARRWQQTAKAPTHDTSSHSGAATDGFIEPLKKKRGRPRKGVAIKEAVPKHKTKLNEEDSPFATRSEPEQKSKATRGMKIATPKEQSNEMALMRRDSIPQAATTKTDKRDDPRSTESRSDDITTRQRSTNDDRGHIEVGVENSLADGSTGTRGAKDGESPSVVGDSAKSSASSSLGEDLPNRPSRNALGSGANGSAPSTRKVKTSKKEKELQEPSRLTSIEHEQQIKDRRDASKLSLETTQLDAASTEVQADEEREIASEAPSEGSQSTAALDSGEAIVPRIKSSSLPPRDGQARSSFSSKVSANRELAAKIFSQWQTVQCDALARGDSQHLHRANGLAQLVRGFRVPLSQGSRDAIASYRRYTAECLTSILDRHENDPRSAPDDAFKKSCLRIEAASLCGDTQAAQHQLAQLYVERRDLFEALPQDATQWFAENKRESRSPFVCLTNAMTSFLSARLHQLSQEPEAGIARSEAARDVFIWMLDRPETFALVTFANAELQRNFSDLISSHDDMIGVLRNYVRWRECLPADVQKGAETILLELISAYDLFAVGVLYRWCTDHLIPLREVILRALLRFFARLGDNSSADHVARGLFDALKSDQGSLQQNTCRAMALYFARTRNASCFEETLDAMQQQFDKNADLSVFLQRARILFFTIDGKPNEVARLLSSEYNMDVHSSESTLANLKRPDESAYAHLASAYLNADRIDDAQRLVAEQIRSDLQPTLGVMNELLHAYVKRGDKEASLNLFRALEAEGRVNTVTYTVLLQLFSRSKDVSSAINLVASMRSRGVKVDRKLLGLLLDAHVEAGDWTGALRVFDYLENSGDPSIRPGPSEYNTMLKAHVQRALPVQQTYRFFNNMMRRGLQPSSVTFSLILQAACDAGIMDLAEDLFTVIEDRLGGQDGMPVNKGANAWHFTIMVKAYFRVRRPDIAKDYLQELYSRNLPITGALRNILVSASANETHSSAVEEAQELARTYVAEAPDQVLAIYSPLMQAASKRGDSDTVDALIDELVSRDIQVPIHTWTILLDSLRRDNQLDAAMALWGQIFRQALDAPSFDASQKELKAKVNNEEVKHVKHSHRNALCLPLTIMIELLTRNQRYEDVAKIWIKCRKHGFQFDSHNWNHMTVALLRAHRMTDAFGIIEYVLDSAPPTSDWRMRQPQDDDIRTWLDANASAGSLDELLLPKVSAVSGEINDVLGEALEGQAKTPQKPPNRRHRTRTRDRLDTGVPLTLLHRAKRGDGIDDASFAGASDIVDPAGPHNEASSSLLARRRNGQRSLRELVARELLERMQSPWFAHFETMQTLSEIVAEADRQGGYLDAATGSASPRISINDLMQRFPRVRALLAAHDEKISEIRERAREYVLSQPR